MNHQQLLDQVKQYVVRFNRSKSDQKLIYHNLEHTESVVSNAGQIARHYNMNEKDFFIVTAAAWFHDTGYYTGGPTDHESRGAELARQFLKGLQCDVETIQAVENCIIATRMPQSPGNLNEQVVCDADLFHLGTTEFPVRNKKMRKEIEARKGKKISRNVWRRETIRMMEAHQYQTDFCRNLLDLQKRENLDDLKRKEAEERGSNAETVGPSVARERIADTAIKETARKIKTDRPERGIETMFRITSNNHQRLSDMADNKAHIMITTTSIIISVLLSVLLRKLEDNPHLIIPTLILLAVCVITMVFSILATRPALPPGTFSQQDIEMKKVNLLFFGNFYRMSFDEYDQGMKRMMEDRGFLYGSLTRDVYSQGIVLGKKYGLLRKGYTVFMYGIVASVIAFFVASVLF